MLSASGRGRPKVKGQTYVPSYMNLSNGPEPCAVCGDAATGFHYRCMTCEGCKGFFRRTIQKNLKYVCKNDSKCVIDKSTRNHCQQCRYRKCMMVGMATDLVLNDNERLAKRHLIEENRERRRLELVRSQIYGDQISDHEQNLIESVTKAFCVTIKEDKCIDPEQVLPSSSDLPEGYFMAAYGQKITAFAHSIPAFSEICDKDQKTVMRNCWFDVALFRLALSYDRQQHKFVFRSGIALGAKDIVEGQSRSPFVMSVFELCHNLAKLSLDDAEFALALSLVLFNFDVASLHCAALIGRLQDSLMSVLKHYVRQTYPADSVRWPKILLRLAELKAVTKQHHEKLARRENTIVLAEILGA